MSKGLEMLEILKQRNDTLKINHKIGSRDIANQEIKEITQCFDNYVIPVIEKDLEQLEQLEDIEEELGIDLITLFKALKNDFYFKYKDKIISSNDYLFQIRANIRGNWVFDIISDNLSLLSIKFKDYGKTWALDKQTLEK